MNKFNEKLLHEKSISDKLWRPNEKTFVEEIKSPFANNSWFSCKENYAKKSEQKVISKLDNISKDQLRIRTIRIKLNKVLERRIKESIFVTRALYNKCIDLCCRDNPIPVNLEELRNLLTYNRESNILPDEQRNQFAKVPSHIRDDALRDFVKAYKIQKQLVKQEVITHFTMDYRKRKDKIRESISVQHKDFHFDVDGNYCLFPRIWGKNAILQTYKEKLPDKINHDCRLIMKTTGNNEKFYLAIPTNTEQKTKIEKLNAVSLDPGVKIFQTAYDTEGSSYLIGENDIEKLNQMSKIADRMRNGIKRTVMNNKKVFYKTTNEKERKGLIKAAENVEQKIKNKISDMHRKTANFLCEKYDTVIIPNFQTKQMAEKKDENGKWKRKIGKDTTRKMIRWGHYQFRQLLIAKGEATGTNVYIGTEEWTSKTCGNCFYINHKLKGERTLECENCGYICHRDVNAARNIMILNFDKSGIKFVPSKVTLNICKK